MPKYPVSEKRLAQDKASFQASIADKDQATQARYMRAWTQYHNEGSDRVKFIYRVTGTFKGEKREVFVTTRQGTPKATKTTRDQVREAASVYEMENPKLELVSSIDTWTGMRVMDEQKMGRNIDG